jgi:hypothetical protein
VIAPIVLVCIQVRARGVVLVAQKPKEAIAHDHYVRPQRKQGEYHRPHNHEPPPWPLRTLGSAHLCKSRCRSSRRRDSAECPYCDPTTPRVPAIPSPYHTVRVPVEEQQSGAKRLWFSKRSESRTRSGEERSWINQAVPRAIGRLSIPRTSKRISNIRSKSGQLWIRPL